MTVRRKLISLFLVVTIAAGLLSPAPSLTAEAAAKTNQQYIFSFLVNKMKLNPAAACGVMANIQKESGFQARTYGDSGTSYGLCQWHKSRFTALKSYCKKYKYDYTTVKGQMAFLKYELKNEYPKILRYMRSVSNDAYGAYQAGYYWCYHFERPAKYLTSSVTRGNLARSYYWPKFGKNASKYSEEEEEDTVTPAIVSELEIPEVIHEGERLAFTGTVSSPSELRKVTAGFYYIDETAVHVKSVDPSGKKCSLADISKMVHSDKLEAGVYLFQLTAQNAAGTVLLASSNVTVLARTGDIISGNYTIAPSLDKKLMLAPTAAGKAGLSLTADVKSETTHFQFARFTEGYYSVRSLSENKYLTLGADGKLRLEKWAASDGQLWQFVNGSGKLNCLIPKSHPDRCLTVKGKQLKDKAKMTISHTVQEEAQFFRLFEANDDSPIQKPEREIDNSLYLEIPKSSLTTAYDGEEPDLKAWSNGALTFESSDPAVAAADESGKITLTGYGKTVFTVTASKEGSNDKIVKAALTVYPAKAKITEAKSYKKKTAKITWKADPLAHGYDLQISPDGKFKAADTIIKTIKKSETDTLTVKKLTRGAEYSVRIRAYKAVNGKLLAGEWSSVKTVKIK